MRLIRLSPFLSVLTVFLGCIPGTQPQEGGNSAAETMPQRIISTMPSITEVLFDIGLGSLIIGDSQHTTYPPEAQHIEKIGGHFDASYEKIISLKPDLIIVSIENRSLRQSLRLPTLIVNHQTLPGVLESYLIIGNYFGGNVLETATQRHQALSDRLDAFANDGQENRTQRNPIRTLICIDRSYGTGRIQNLYVAGSESFLSEAVDKAGGKNVAASLGLLAPALSAEGVIHLAPDVIIDIQVRDRDLTQSLSDWHSLGDSVPAIKYGRILVLTDDFASIPGPRTPMLIEKIARYFDTLYNGTATLPTE